MGDKPSEGTFSGPVFSIHDHTDQNQKWKAKLKDKTFKCPDCDLVFGLVSTLLQHIRKHTGEKPFKCVKCGSTFAYECSLQYHMRVHKKELGNRGTDQQASLASGTYNKSPQLAAGNDYTLKTPKSNAETSSEQNPLYYNPTCEDENVLAYAPLQKEKCAQRPEHPVNPSEMTESAKPPASEQTSDSILQIKKKRNGKSDKPFKCTKCRLSFLQSVTLIQHMRKHTGEKPFKCKECPAAFTYECSLLFHERMHAETKIATKNLASYGTCDDCASGRPKFKKGARLHTRETFRALDSPFKCCICGNIAENKKVADHDKPHKCLKCAAAFTTKTRLKKHMMKHKLRNF